MSTGEKIGGYLLWATIVVLISLAAVTLILGTNTYSGTEVSFTVSGNQFINIEANSPVRLQAADAGYFRLVQGEVQLYGIPYSPPMGDPNSGYFFIESERVEGEWEVTEGFKVDLLLSSNSPFEVTKYPTDDAKEGIRLAGVVIGLLVLVSGIAIWEQIWG